MNISQCLLPFQLIQDTSKVMITFFGGLPWVVETFRALGAPQSIQKHPSHLQRQGKYEEAGKNTPGKILLDIKRTS